jgi:hypothetical protein
VDFDVTLHPELAEAAQTTQRLYALNQFLRQGTVARFEDGRVPGPVAAAYDRAVVAALKAVERIATGS